jgi:hypothetical protein
MDLDSENRLAPGHHTGPQDFSTLAQAARAAFLDTTVPQVQVVFKKRRVFGEWPEQDEAASAAVVASDGDGDRRPRVFVLPKEPTRGNAADLTATAAHNANASANASANAQGAPVLPRRRRRRASPLQRPSPVVHIVPPAPEPGLDTARACDVDDTPVFSLPPLPAHDQYRSVQAALGRLKTLVRDAEEARRFSVAPALRIAPRPRG